MDEEHKSSKSRIKNLLSIIVIILIAPFLYPLILRGLIKFKLFSSVEEYLEYITPFSNRYTLFVILILLFLIFIIVINKSGSIKEFFMGFDFNFKFGDKEVGIKSKDLIKSPQEIFSKNIEIDKEESNEAKIQIKDGLNKTKNKNLNSKDEEIRELTNIIDNIRFFSAYNNTNYVCSELLIYLYKRKTISKVEFEEKMRYYYNSRIRNVIGKRKRECVNRKVEEKIFNYKYLDIIEISDDNEYIILTDLGKKFVEEYLMKGVDGNV